MNIETYEGDALEKWAVVQIWLDLFFFGVTAKKMIEMGYWAVGPWAKSHLREHYHSKAEYKFEKDTKAGWSAGSWPMTNRELTHQHISKGPGEKRGDKRRDTVYGMLSLLRINNLTLSGVAIHEITENVIKPFSWDHCASGTVVWIAKAFNSSNKKGSHRQMPIPILIRFAWKTEENTE